MLLVKSIPNDISQDLSLVDEFTQDTLSDYIINILYIQTYQNEDFVKYTVHVPEIKLLLKSFRDNYSSGNKLETKGIEISNIEMEGITAKCFKRLFIRKHKDPYKLMKRKYNTTKTIAFSHIEYNQEHAILYYEHLNGYLCGTGNLIIMKKENSQWKLNSKINLWVS